MINSGQQTAAIPIQPPGCITVISNEATLTDFMDTTYLGFPGFEFPDLFPEGIKK